MNKDLKKLYDYCKSQGYEDSPEEFVQELNDLIVEEIDSKELSKVAGGNKLTKAAAASLFSALSIASPFASAAQTIKPNNQTVNSNFKIQNGINQSQKNKKMLKDILLKEVLPIGVIGLGVPTLVGTGILIKNKIADNTLNDKTCRFLAQILADSFNDCADYCKNASPGEKERIAKKISCQKIDGLQSASEVCEHIIYNDWWSGRSYSSWGHPSDYSHLREFVSSGQVEENNGKFIIDDHIKRCFNCFHRIIDQKVIASPKYIYDGYMKGNTKLINQITKDPYVQKSMQKLEETIKDLKEEVKKRELTQLVPKINIDHSQEEQIELHKECLCQELKQLNELQQLVNFQQSLCQRAKLLQENPQEMQKLIQEIQSQTQLVELLQAWQSLGTLGKNPSIQEILQKLQPQLIQLDKQTQLIQKLNQPIMLQRLSTRMEQLLQLIVNLQDIKELLELMCEYHKLLSENQQLLRECHELLSEKQQLMQATLYSQKSVAQSIIEKLQSDIEKLQSIIEKLQSGIEKSQSGMREIIEKLQNIQNNQELIRKELQQQREEILLHLLMCNSYSQT